MMQAIVYLRARAQLYQLGGVISAHPAAGGRGCCMYLARHAHAHAHTRPALLLSRLMPFILVCCHIQVVLEKYKVPDRNLIFKPLVNENSCHNQT